MDKRTITGWSIAVTWSDGKRENILDIPDEVAQYIDAYLTEIEEHGDLAKPGTELIRENDFLDKQSNAEYYDEKN
jgi:hypothetical protein